MARSQSEKASIHEAIVSAAATRFRERGIDGIGIADLMKEVGRTGGGFYKHFESREELVQEALDRVFEQRAKKMAANAGADITKLAADYLNEAHRDSPGTGCGVSALVSDVARASEPVRSRYTRQVEREISHIADALGEERQSDQRGDAVVALCALVGALALSRAVNDARLSREILATRKRLLQMLSDE
jgi:TetR/AcrR family transcriptional repressor of nem operon